MGVDQGRFRLKGLFAFGLFALTLGYMAPVAGIAAGPAAPAARTLSARLDAADVAGGGGVAGRPRPLRVAEETRVYGDRAARQGLRLRTELVPLPFATRQLADPALPAGTTIVDAPGSAGLTTDLLQESLIDGEVVDSSVLSSVTRPAADRVVRLGSATPTPAPAPAPDLGGAPSAYLRAIAGSSTSYCDLGHTATGTQAGPGSIAVDPSVIPLGSHLYVPGYGYGWAVDTGGAIKGPIVDVWLTCDAATRWGRRQLTIYVVP